MKNLYNILEVSEKASSEIIEKAYKTLAKKYHPDLQANSQKEYAEKKMKELNEAYEILSNPEKRKQFDRTLLEYRQRIEAEKIQKIRQEQAQYNPQVIKETSSTIEKRENTNNDTYKDKYNNVYNNAYKEGYQEGYLNFFRSQGYKVKEPWTLKRVKELVKSILIFSLVLIFIWIFPPTHNLIVNTYENNDLLKGLIDGIIKFIKSFFNSLFTSFFNK